MNTRSYLFVLLLVLITIVIRTEVHCSDFESLSYGSDVLSGKVSPTEKPIETTTKKKGFFSGIKNFFTGSKKDETTTTTTTTTTAKPLQIEIDVTPSSAKPSIPSSPTPAQRPTPSTGAPFPVINRNNFPSSIQTSTTTSTTAKPSNQRDYIAPVRPSSPGNFGSAEPSFPTISTSTTTGKPDNRRDYVAPSRPPYPGSPTPTTTTTTVAPNNRRDYVAPIRPSSPPGGLPGGPSTGGNFPLVTPSSPTPSNRRDYVNPNIPVRPSIPPRQPQVTQAPPVPPRPGSPNILDDKDFPPLSPSRGGPRPTSPTTKPGERVSFIPGRPSPGGTTNTGGSKNQLAKDDELATLTESLLTKDSNNQNQHVTVNLQGKTKSTERTDEAPDPLLDVKEQALESPTIAKMRLLYNNYEIDTSVNEYVTPIERKEENDFIDAVMATSVMRAAMQFLQNKGIVTPDPKTHREYLKTLWFTLYSRGGGRIGSSAFEHVFLNEIKNGTVIGMHNWIYYFEEEKLGHADYKGYIRKVDLGNKGSILKFRFNYNGLEKYANTLFIGTSPELEMALYTVCFAVRADQDCPISLNEKKINIVTHTWKYRGKQLIGSAYPEI